MRLCSYLWWRLFQRSSAFPAQAYVGCSCTTKHKTKTTKCKRQSDVVRLSSGCVFISSRVPSTAELAVLTGNVAPVFSSSTFLSTYSYPLSTLPSRPLPVYPTVLPASSHTPGPGGLREALTIISSRSSSSSSSSSSSITTIIKISSSSSSRNC